ncbi:monovalent cation/H(+) antiporter subunit G [Ectothiorhodospiraceae bacterium 2226]|nr:monovalent cation/H(+) antiporter subunit G [Ectothiorhodospiraceae bacterium 2226]
MILDLLSLLLVVTGALFFAAGTVGLLRFPDVYTRLHAITKADNVGLGLMIVGLMLQAEGAAQVVKLLTIWLLVLFASATACHLIARAALREGVAAWRRR